MCNLARALADDEHKKIGAKLYIYSYIVGTEQLLKGVKTIGYWGTTHFECSGFLDNQDDDEDYED